MQNIPEVDEAKKSIRFAIIQTLGIAIVVIIGIILYSNYSIESSKTFEKQKIEGELIELTTLSRNSIEKDMADLRSGKLSREETLKNVILKIRSMTYKDRYGENYIFLIDYDGHLLVQPYQPLLENTNQWDMQDVNGVFLIRDLIKTAKSGKEGGFVTYQYKPPNLEVEEEKLSYVIDIPELECIIGTGKYLRLYYEAQSTSIKQATTIASLLALVVILLSLNSLRRIRSTGKRLEYEIIKRGSIQTKLADSEMNLRAVFNAMSDVIIIHTTDGVIIETNDRVKDMFGCKRDELIGKQLVDISAEGEFVEEDYKILWEKTLNGESPVFEYRVKRVDTGMEFFVEVAIRTATWYGQAVILSAVRDIQERKFVERELRRNQVMNEQAEGMGLYGNYSFDLKTREVTWSKGLYEIFKWDWNSSPPGMEEYLSLIVPEDRDRFMDIVKISVDTGETQKLEYRIKRPDGEIRCLSVILDWLPDEKEKRRYILGSIRDVTEKNRAIEEIRHSEEKFRTTVQQMTDGLVLIDEDGVVIEWNRGNELITGVSSDDVIGKSIWENESLKKIYESSSFDYKKIGKEIRRALSTGASKYQNTPIEMPILSAGGEQRIVKFTLFTIRVDHRYRLGLITHDITEEKAALEKINHELMKLASLRKIDATIMERNDPEKTLEMICSIAVDQLKVDGAITLARLSADNLAQACISRIDTSEEQIVCRTLELQAASLKQNLRQPFSAKKLELINQILPFDSASGKALQHAILPLVVNKRIIGYMQVFSRKAIPTDQEWKDYFHTLAGQTSIAIENITLIANEELAYSELNQAYESTIAGWSKALELRDEETKGHSDRVMVLASKLAKKARLPQSRMDSFRRGVLLHDIGKMGIPDRILLKPGALNEEEWKIMRQHPVMAYDLLSSIPYLKDSLEVPYAHHEHWDGSGYPRGLKGKEIPLSARIFTIVDVWDALSSDRPYRKGWDRLTVTKYLMDNKSVLFDPRLVDLFLEMINQTDSAKNPASNEITD